MKQYSARLLTKVTRKRYKDTDEVVVKMAVLLELGMLLGPLLPLTLPLLCASVLGEVLLAVFCWRATVLG